MKQANENYEPFQKAIMVGKAADTEPTKSVQRPQPTPRPRPTPPTRPFTIIVTNTNDNGPGSLRQALADAGDGYTIIFSITGTIGLTSGELLVDKFIYISGPGADTLAVDGGATGRVFHIGTGKRVVISGMTIMNGNTCCSSPNGGGIYNDHAVLRINDCAIRGNVAINGGGVYNDGSNGVASAVINNTIFTNNSASNGDGGAIYNSGYSGVGNLIVQTSTLTGNSAMNGGGAGVANDQATATLNNCVVAGNSAGGGGAATNGGYLGGYAQLEIIDSILSDNSAFNVGGAIINGGTAGTANVYISGSTVSGNSAGNVGGGVLSDESDNGAVNLQITSSTLSGNSAGNVAGGIENSALTGTANVYISNSTISGNSADNGGGGVVSTGGFPPSSNATVNLYITNTTFSGNSSPNGGGAISSGGNYGTNPIVSLSNTILNAGTSGPNIDGEGTVMSLGYNLSSDDGGGHLTGPGDQVNTDPLLGPLQNNGGPTLTHALVAGSPAIDAGDPSFTPPPFYDQRGPGFNRVVNGRIDIGSFEVQIPTGTTRPTATPLTNR
jgi:predicted outer membrane repeat protein